MSVIITDQASSIEFLFSNGERKILDKQPLNIKESGVLRKYVYITNSEGFLNTADNDVIKLHHSEVTSPSVASNQELIDALLGYKASSGITVGDVRITDGTTILKIEPNGSMPATLQDQYTPLVVTKFSILEETTTTTVSNAIGDYTITVASATGITAGKLITIFDPTSVRFTQFRVIGVAGNVVTLDGPMDFAYPIGSYIDIAESNLNVDGSSTPIIAGIRNNAGAVPPPGLNLTVDITRLIFKCYTSTAPTLSDFGDIANGLTNGLLLRNRNGDYYNIFNVKDNGELAGIMYDFDMLAVGGGGQDGFKGRLTFGGQSKFGVVIRLPINEDLELIIQDDLTSLVELEVTAEGSIVQD